MTMTVSPDEPLVVDSSILRMLIADARGRRDCAHWPSGTVERLRSGDLRLTPFVLAEQLSLMRRNGADDRALDRVEARLRTRHRALVPDDETTRWWARIAAQNRGRKAQHNDLWIAALGTQSNIRVVTADKDIPELAGVTPEPWYLPRMTDSKAPRRP